jgi:hypothetical protein
MARAHGVTVILILAMALCSAGPADAQPQAPAGAGKLAARAARAADVSSPDAIIAAVYEAISGPAGQKRDWDRFRPLFIPGARLIPSMRHAEGTTAPVVWSPDEYIAAAGAGLDKNGFFERELHRETEAFGAVLHAFSTYDSKRTPQDAQPFARGINSFQLYHDGTRWWIVTIYWDAETPQKPIPPKYLGK